MSLLAFTLSLAAFPMAASSTDWAGMAAFITAIGGVLLGAAALIVNRRQPDPPPPPPSATKAGEVSDVIRLVQDLERCKDERNALATQNDTLRTQLLEMNDELGRLRRDRDRRARSKRAGA